MSDDNDMAYPFIVMRRAKRKGFSISNRAFRSDGEIDRELWWFGDKEF